MANIHDHVFSVLFGLLGNILSFLVYLAPLPTFYTIFKKKSTEGFQSIPYSAALFSAMLYLYYAFLKKHDAFMLITINSIGCSVESIYLFFYMIYATKSARIYTTKLLIFFNIGALGLIILVTFIFSKGSSRVSIVGWICAVFSVCVFAAPLSIIRSVIRTKSVEYMPFSLSFFLTLCAVTWFLYGFSLRDYYIATPNILGFSFGITQMILYLLYRGGRKEVIFPENKPKELMLAESKPHVEQLVNFGVQMIQPQEVAIMNNEDGGIMISKSQIVPSELNV
ncbi:bidirectional sugar transporter SWEET9-like [Durio zibethinus]|uniref:Bidirectional sugar transporter SWEET n=1 Tax=Durio zibethinus TaxID=66656 RepID=A0A6P6A4K0_DURZI|nr:bidirectional sugar transporter SWEET9-like [Durio zibethinus]